MAYRIGSIYRITKIDDPTINYIGSTFKTLQQRWRVHKSKKENGCSIGKLLNKYGCDKFKIVVIQKYQVCDDKHLRAYEQLWINKYKMNKSCINKQDAFCILKKEQKKQYRLEHREEMKEYQKEYKLEHKEQLKEKLKQYRLEHREHLKAKSKQYNQENKEKRKQYRLEHKEQIKARKGEKIECECGCIIIRDMIARHRRSTKHISIMNSN
tara:strand:- start:29 stop:661 length:633 start_codon:yes stop_codon:yes gene_type:complete